MSIDSSILSIENVSNYAENTTKELIDVNLTYTNINNKKKITRPYLTKFEKSKLLGIRAQQLSNGADPMVPITSSETNIIKIAEKELYHKKIPLLVRRYLPNNEYEDWRLKDFLN